MNLVKTRIDPNNIFFINEKNKAVPNKLECNTCGNLIYTSDNYSNNHILKEDCPYCSGFFPQPENT